MSGSAGGTDGPLKPYRVIDLSDESGFLCGKTLGDLGADVIKIEPPGGDAARQLGPFPSDRPDPEKSLYWIGYNSNKRGITLDLETEDGRRLLRKLVGSADFLIETQPPGRLSDLGLGRSVLGTLNPRLVQISITPFGQSGPYRDYRGSDLVAMAMSGLISLIGEPDRPPLRVSLPQSPLWTGMYAVAGGLIAHYHRELTGEGQQVDSSLQSGLLWALANAPSFWSTNRTYPRREGRRITGRSLTGATMQAIYRCRDGYINFIVYGGAAGRSSNEALARWMAEEGLPADKLLEKDWGRFDIQHSSQEEIDEIEGPAAELLRSCTKLEFLQQAHQRGILGYPVAEPSDILQDDQLEARGFWRRKDCARLGKNLMIPGPFALFSETPIDIRRPAPRLGEHNAEVYQGELGLSRSELYSLEERGII